MNSFEKLVSTIKQTRSHKPMIIGIEGFGGSGKTTLAKKLHDSLKDACVISIDDFIVKEKLTEASWDKGGFDRTRLEKQVLLPLSKKEQTSYQKLIWQQNVLSEPIKIPDVEYIIIEGISVYHPGIDKYYDFKIWIDTPLEVAKKRGQSRDGSNENAANWDLWAENDIRYFDKYRPKERADYTYTDS